MVAAYSTVYSQCYPEGQGCWGAPVAHAAADKKVASGCQTGLVAVIFCGIIAEIQLLYVLCPHSRSAGMTIIPTLRYNNCNAKQLCCMAGLVAHRATAYIATIDRRFAGAGKTGVKRLWRL